MRKEKSVGKAYAFWMFTGLFGGHKFYLGKTGMGLLYLFTMGLFSFGWMIDMFTIPDQVKEANRK